MFRRCNPHPERPISPSRRTPPSPSADPSCRDTRRNAALGRQNLTVAQVLHMQLRPADWQRSSLGCSALNGSRTVLAGGSLPSRNPARCDDGPAHQSQPGQRPAAHPDGVATGSAPTPAPGPAGQKPMHQPARRLRPTGSVACDSPDAATCSGPICVHRRASAVICVEPFLQRTPAWPRPSPSALPRPQDKKATTPMHANGPWRPDQRQKRVHREATAASGLAAAGLSPATTRTSRLGATRAFDALFAAMLPTPGCALASWRGQHPMHREPAMRLPGRAGVAGKRTDAPNDFW